TIEPAVAETRLLEQLNLHIPIDKNYADMEQTEEHLKTIFWEKGFYFHGGRVFPHYGPFIWKTTNQKTYHVDIPNTTEEVKIYFLDDFLMSGWLHFATFGEVYAGGWAVKDGLYCILPRYRDK